MVKDIVDGSQGIVDFHGDQSKKMLCIGWTHGNGHKMWIFISQVHAHQTELIANKIRNNFQNRLTQPVDIYKSVPSCTMGTAAPVLVQQTREWNAMMADMEATR